jgi:hypothetical protein
VTELLKQLEAGKFISRWDFRLFGYQDTKAMDGALYKLRKKGHDIRTVREAGETMYYLKKKEL